MRGKYEVLRARYVTAKNQSENVLECIKFSYRQSKIIQFVFYDTGKKMPQLDLNFCTKYSIKSLTYNGFCLHKFGMVHVLCTP